MLEEILMHLNNWFLVPDGVHEDTYTIEGGSITLPFLVNGQYFRICGSVFNDGLYTYPAEELFDETFDGTIWALAIPKQVIKLSDEIQEWKIKNGDISPYTSESFGGYSYSKATNSKGAPMGWQDVFKAQLNKWRKIGENSYRVGTNLIKPYYRPWNPDYPLGGDW